MQNAVKSTRRSWTMVKQKKAGKQKGTTLSSLKSLTFSNSNDSVEVDGKKKPTIQSSRLLPLPPELRNRIWKTVVDIDHVHLFAQWYSNGAPAQVQSLGSISLTRNGAVNTETTCANLHQEEKPKRSTKTGKLVNKPRQPGVLSWLRTNRQVRTNLSLSAVLLWKAGNWEVDFLSGHGNETLPVCYNVSAPKLS